MPIIYLYAEVLANIRQANLYASLKTEKNEHTTINIASDKKTITVTHDGETASIYLPTEIGGTAEVSIPVDRGKDMSLRLELADIKNMPAFEDVLGNEEPWSAKDLGPNTLIRCRACKAELLTNELPLDFKDLPSGNWAEMMDFWHCHRPHDAGPCQEDAMTAHSKGYGSSAKLKAAPGIAFLDSGSFLFAEQSCRNIEVGVTISPILFSFSACPEKTRHKPYWTKSLPLGATRRRPFSRRKRFHVQAADIIAQN
jgi:ubiquitin-protein ligase E3 D